jgi:hypothetical protein
MTRTIRIAAVRKPLDENKLPPLPRRGRIGSAIASGLITAVLFGSVVVGMTSTADDRAVMAGDIAAAHRA